MLLLRDVVTAIGVGLEGHGGHPRGYGWGKPTHVGPASRTCGPQRLRGGATLTGDREIPIGDAGMVLCVTQATTSARLIGATRCLHGEIPAPRPIGQLG